MRRTAQNISHLIPSKIEDAKPYPLALNNMSRKSFVALSAKYFPSGEISIDANGNFAFSLKVSTPSESVINSIIRADAYIKKWMFEEALNVLSSEQEPRQRHSESIDAVVFALFIFYLY